MRRFLLATITLSTCLVLASAEGNTRQRRLRPERLRRQGYQSRQNDLPGGQVSTYSPPATQAVRDPKPEVPALYTLPRSGDTVSRDMSQGTEDGETQDTTTELALENTPEPSKSSGDEVSEAYVTENGVTSSMTPEDLTTTTQDPTSTEISRAGISDDQNRNGIKAVEGYSSNGRGLGEGSGKESDFPGESFDKRKLSDLIEQNLSPTPAYTTNEIPRVYSVRPGAGQQQVENAFFQMKPSGLYRQPMEIREFMQLEPMQNSLNNPKPLVQMNYPEGQKFQMYRHRIIEGLKPSTPQEVSDLSARLNSVDDTFEGLEGHIVDANLLDRVQQIIENHERTQRNFFQNQHEQVMPTLFLTENGNGGYGSRQGPNLGSNFHINAQQPRGGNPGGPSNFENNPYFRLTKTFPENPNLEFQPAILTGHFDQTTDDRVPVDNSTQSVVIDNSGREYYLPPPRSNSQRQSVIPTSPYFQNLPQNYPTVFDTKLSSGSPLRTQQSSQGYTQQQSFSNQNAPYFEPSWVHRSPPFELSHNAPGSSSEPKPETGFHPTFASTDFGNKPDERQFSNNQDSLEGIQSLAAERHAGPHYEGIRAPTGNTRPNVNSLDRSAPSEGRSGGYLYPYMSQFGDRDEAKLMRPTASSPNENPNVITRTIVIHEKAAGSESGSAGLSNRAIVTGADLNGGKESSEGYSGMTLHKTQFPFQNIMSGNGNEIENSDFHQNATQFQFVSASAKLQVGDNRREPITQIPITGNTLYMAPPRQPERPLTLGTMKGQEFGIEEPRPVYGIPIAPVLGPESLDDSVIIEARTQSANSIVPDFRRVNDPRLYQGLDSAGTLPSDSNLFELYRLPRSQEKIRGAFSESHGESNYGRAQDTSELRTVNRVNQFFPPVYSPLAGFFTTSNRF